MLPVTGLNFTLFLRLFIASLSNKYFYSHFYRFKTDKYINSHILMPLRCKFLSFTDSLSITGFLFGKDN
jgi:hypothetical protein